MEIRQKCHAGLSVKFFMLWKVAPWATMAEYYFYKSWCKAYEKNQKNTKKLSLSKAIMVMAAPIIAKDGVGGGGAKPFCQ